MTPSQTVASIGCEKCKAGHMAATRVPKFSGGLRIIGFTLWIPALLVLLGATAFYFMVLAGAAAATATAASATRNPNRPELLAIEAQIVNLEGVSPGLIAHLRAGESIPASDLETMSDASRQQLAQLVREYSDTSGRDAAPAAAGAAIGVAAVTGLGGMALVAIYFILVPTFIVGLVLTMMKKVWRCSHCGYIYDRA